MFMLRSSLPESLILHQTAALKYHQPGCAVSMDLSVVLKQKAAFNRTFFSFVTCVLDPYYFVDV